MAGAEMWTASIAAAASIEPRAGAFEAAGWTGMMVVDSQNLSGDCYVALALASRVTDRLRLGTGVTNPLTRHPAATAAGIGSVQIASGGRASVGIGRGDSALAHLGLAPASVRYLERYARVVRAYLQGAAVPFDELREFAVPGASPLETLGLAEAPEGSVLRWAGAQPEPAPVEIVGSGPSVLAAAARTADRVWIAVGAEPERVQWALSSVAATRAAAGLEGTPPIGAVVNVVAHDDVDVARALVAGGLASTARFSAMHGTVAAPVTEADRDVYEAIARGYKMTRHTHTEADHTRALTPEFVDRFGIAGSARHCAARLRELADLGIDRFLVIGLSSGGDRDAKNRAQALLEEEVVPAVQQR